MFNITIIALVAIALLGIGLLIALAMFKGKGKKCSVEFANVAEGTYCEGVKTYKVDAAFSSRFLLAKVGSDVDHVDVCGATDIPLGINTDSAAAAEEEVGIALFGAAEGTRRVVASAAITLGDMVVAAASGKVKTLPGTTGTYYIIGRAIKAAAADGDVIEIAPTFPIQRVV